MKPSTRAQIPVLVAFVLIVSLAALVLVLLVAGVQGTSADGGAETILGGIASSALGLLVAMWMKDTAPPAPPPEEDERAADALHELPEVKKARETLREHLRDAVWVPRWKPSTP